MKRQQASRLPRRSSIQISNEWHKQASIKNIVDPIYEGADPSKWYVKTFTFDGKFMGMFNKEEVDAEMIIDGIEKFKRNPIKYAGIMYKTEEMNRPKNEQGYALILRDKTFKIFPANVSPEGQYTLMTQEYRRLPPLKNNTLPKLCRDEFTDDMIYKGKKLHTKTNKPLMPGRGMGLLDQPNMKLIGTIDPSDVKQGLIADCWLLSGISTLAEFEGGIQRLFRKTKNLDKMPFDDRPNLYTITLWDMATWTEIDIVIDERLCSRPDSASRQGEMKLLGAKPSDDGELWVPYLEKAVSIHCGGWDKISYGANCNHAWAVLTGVKEQCTILRVADENSNWGCYAKYDPWSKKWAELDNNPWKGCQSVWTVPWPETSGGSFEDWKDTSELTDDQLFRKMCEWDDGNFLMAVSSKGQSDQENTDGIVNKHAYGVVECKDNVAGSGLDMIQVRNPWGKGGELENGQFERGKGPGWKKYPALKRALNPDQDSPGVFWLTKQEFFKYYDKIYLSASDMSEFLGLKPPKPKPVKPKEEKENEEEAHKRKVETPNDKETTPSASMSPVKKPKVESPVKAKPKGFVKVEKNLPKKATGKTSGFVNPLKKKGGGFTKMVPKNKKEEMEKARLAREQKEKEKLEKEREEMERLEKEREEKARKERERQEKEKMEKEKQERERLENEKQAKAKQERDRQEKEKKAMQQLQKQERDRLDAERKEKDKKEREQKEEARLQRESKEREKLERERLQQKEKRERESKEFQDKDATIADLQRRLDEAEKETMDLRSKNTSLTAIQEDLEAEAMEYQEQLESKAVIIDSLTEELNEAYESANPDDNAEELREKSAQLREKTEELNSKNAEIANLKKQLAKARSNALAEESDQKNSAASGQKALVMQHRRELEEKNSIIASMQKEIDNGKRRISALQDNAAELQKANQDLENLSKRQKRKIDHIGSDDGAVSTLRTELEKANRTIQNLSQTKSESERALAKKDKRIDFLRSELQEANQAIQSLERKIGGSRDRDRVRINQLKKQREDKQAELDSKDAKLQTAERAAVESRKRLRDKDDRISSVLNQLQHSRKEVRALVEKNELISKKLTSSEHHVSSLDAQLEEAKHLIQSLEQKNRDSRDREIARLRKQLETKEEEANTQKYQLQQAKEEVQSGRVALREKEQESIELRGALRQLRQEFQSLEQEKNDIYARENRKLKLLQNRLNITEAELETEREKRKQANDRADELEEELNQERKKRRRVTEEQATESNQASDAGHLLKEKEEELNFMGRKLRRMTMHQQQSSRHLGDEMTRKDGQISDLQKQVDELQRENEELYEKNANQISQSKKIHGLEIELDKQKNLSAMWEVDMAALQHTVDEQNSRIARLDMAVAERDSLIQSLEQKVAEQAHAMALKSNDSARHEKAISDLNRKLEAAQEQLKQRPLEGDSDGSIRERMDELERELWEARDDSDSLRNTIKMQEAELEEKDAVIKSLTRRLKDTSQEPSSFVQQLRGSDLTSARGREPSTYSDRISTAHRIQDRTSGAALTPNFTEARARESASTPESERDPNFASERVREQNLASVPAEEHRPSAKQDRLLESGNANMTRETQEVSRGSRKFAKNLRPIDHLQPEYDSMPRNRDLRPVSQDSSLEQDQAQGMNLRPVDHLPSEYDSRPTDRVLRPVSQDRNLDQERAQGKNLRPVDYLQSEYDSVLPDRDLRPLSQERRMDQEQELGMNSRPVDHLQPKYDSMPPNRDMRPISQDRNTDQERSQRMNSRPVDHLKSEYGSRPRNRDLRPVSQDRRLDQEQQLPVGMNLRPADHLQSEYDSTPRNRDLRPASQDRRSFDQEQPQMQAKNLRAVDYLQSKYDSMPPNRDLRPTSQDRNLDQERAQGMNLRPVDHLQSEYNSMFTERDTRPVSQDRRLDQEQELGMNLRPADYLQSEYDSTPRNRDLRPVSQDRSFDQEQPHVQAKNLRAADHLQSEFDSMPLNPDLRPRSQDGNLHRERAHGMNLRPVDRLQSEYHSMPIDRDLRPASQDSRMDQEQELGMNFRPADPLQSEYDSTPRNRDLRPVSQDRRMEHERAQGMNLRQVDHLQSEYDSMPTDRDFRPVSQDRSLDQEQAQGKNLRPVDHLQSEYDSTPRNRDLRPVSQDKSLDQEQAQGKNLRPVDHLQSEYDSTPRNLDLRPASQDRRVGHEQAQGINLRPVDHLQPEYYSMPPDRDFRPVSQDRSLDQEQAQGKNLRPVDDLQSDYDSMPRNRFLRPLSQDRSFDQEQTQGQRLLSSQDWQLQPRDANATRSVGDEISGNPRLSKGLRAPEHQHARYETLVRYPDLRHESEEEEIIEIEGTRDIHIRIPALPEYERRTKSDPPVGAGTANSQGIHDNSLPPEVDGSKRAVSGAKWYEEELPFDMIEDELEQSKTEDDLIWNEKPDLHVPVPRDDRRTKQADISRSKLSIDEEHQRDIFKAQARDQRRLARGDFGEGDDIDENEWEGEPNIKYWSNDRGSRNEASRKDEEKWNSKPRKHTAYGRNNKPIGYGDFDEKSGLDDEKFNGELAMYTSNPRDYGRRRHDVYYDDRVREERKGNEKGDLIATNPRLHERPMTNQGFDKSKDQGNEKWREQMDLQTSRPIGHSRRRDYNESRVIEDGKWNEELGIYIQPTIAARYYQDSNPNLSVSRSRRETNDGSRTPHMEPPPDYNSPWYYDSQSPIGNWQEGWDSNLRSRPEDHRMRRNDPGGIRLSTRGDVDNERWSFEEDSRQRESESDQFTSEAHILGSMNSWAESNGSQQQQQQQPQKQQQEQYGTERVAGKQNGGTDSINDYLARLFEKVQATKSELEATQKRLNHTVGRHLVHE